MLPTDSRFTSLTEEQLDLIHANFLADKQELEALKKPTKDTDVEYNNSEPERYYDPEFDDIWNDTGAEDISALTSNSEEWEEV